MYVDGDLDQIFGRRKCSLSKFQWQSNLPGNSVLTMDFIWQVNKIYKEKFFDDWKYKKRAKFSICLRYDTSTNFESYFENISHWLSSIF